MTIYKALQVISYKIHLYPVLGNRVKIIYPRKKEFLMMSNYFRTSYTLWYCLKTHHPNYEKFIFYPYFRHHCDVIGCGRALIIDGGLKPHRPICQAKLNGVKKFTLAGVVTVTGCTAIPLPGEKFCKEHLQEESPVIPTDFSELSREPS